VASLIAEWIIGTFRLLGEAILAVFGEKAAAGVEEKRKGKSKATERLCFMKRKEREQELFKGGSSSRGPPPAPGGKDTSEVLGKRTAFLPGGTFIFLSPKVESFCAEGRNLLQGGGRPWSWERRGEVPLRYVLHLSPAPGGRT